MENVIIVLILVLIVGAIVWFLIRSKKKGEVCIGCPHAKQCGGKCGSCQSNKNDNGKTNG